MLNLAADQGNMDAFYEIAELYRRRKSGDNPRVQTFTDATAWCKLALDAGHPYAQSKMCEMVVVMKRLK